MIKNGCSRRSVIPLLCLLAAFSAPLQAQERQITGTVTAADTGEGLPLVAVAVGGTAISVGTNAAGEFTVVAPAGEVTLQFTTLGYATQEVVVPPGQDRVTVVLERDVLNLEAIVATGQATSVSRRNLANSVASVSAEQLDRASPSESVEKMMQGMIPGANIETNSGAPGGGVQVRLRGTSTIIGESEPLYVIDGVIMSNVAIPSNQNAVTMAAGGSNPSLQQDAVVNRLVDLNPADIANIEVLKGASAAALYGSRASNGVVLITTKRGTPGETRINVNQRFGFFDPSETIGFRDWTLDEAVDVFVSDVEQYFGSDGLPLETFDQERLLSSRSSLSSDTQVSMRGGSETTRFFVSGAWKSDDGTIPNTGFERQSLRANIDQVIHDRLRISTHASLLRTLARRGLTNNDNSGTSFYMTLPSTPNFVDLRPGPDGVYPTNPFERSNPLQTANLLKNEEEVWRLMGGVTGELDVFRSERHRFSLLGTGGADYFTQENDLLFPPELQFEPRGVRGASLLSDSDNLDLTLSGQGVYGYTTAGGWELTTTAGFQWEARELNTARVSAFGLTAGQPNIDSGVIQEQRQQRLRVRDLGLFVQEEALLFGDRLLLTAGVRADRSSANGDTDRFFWFPKAAGSYRFENLVPHVDDLKLRVAYGESGNQPLFGQKFTPLTSTNVIEGLPGLVVDGAAGDPDLQPERQREIEAGFDLTLFDQRAQLEATVFQKNIDDLLLERTPAPSTGFDLQVFNGGEMRVRGIELGLSATPITRGEFQWVSRTTFHRNYSEVTELPVPTFDTGGFGTALGAFRIEQGASATQIVTNLGLDDDGNVIVGRVGDANPSFRMSFSNDFTWGPFSLSSLLDLSEGATVINLTQFLIDGAQNAEDFEANPRDVTLPDGEVVRDVGDGEMRALLLNEFADSRGYMEDGSYVKLREVTLGYDLPESALRTVFGNVVSNARLTLSGRNLLTFTDYTGLDPEVSNFGNQSIARNIDVAPFPPNRSYWFGFNVNF